MQAYRITDPREGKPTLARVELAEPKVRPGEVLVEVGAASLNYRDLIVAKANTGLIPLSDGAGVICAVGSDVTDRQVGERVVIGFMPGWIDGAFTEAKLASALGGKNVDGVLTERIAVPAAAVVRIPDHMSFEEAACLPCAGVTAWCSLFERRPLLKNETVLLPGTGGVSVFALQLAVSAGAKVILTSSSDEKLERAAKLGAGTLINYRRTPHWAAEVLRQTQGHGVDLAVEVGGPGTLNQTIESVRADGRISLVGVLTGSAGEIQVASILHRRITVQGIYVGSITALRALVPVAPKPVIHEVFRFEEAQAAYALLASGEHFGKIVVRVKPSNLS